MNLGSQIRFFRNLRGMSQKELGVMVGLGENCGAKRIVQYEMDYRVPKKLLLQKIANALNVSPAALTVVNHIHPIDIMHLLFLAEDKYGLQIEATEQKFSLYFNLSSFDLCFQEYLTYWNEIQKKYKENKLNKEDYNQWKYSFNGNIPK